MRVGLRGLAGCASALLLSTAIWMPAAGSSATPGSAPGRDDADPVRILVVGDSISQGSAGDWTWRYRLAKHLQAVGVDADLVGTWDSLFDVVHGTWGSEAYLDPGFDRDHAAVWGGSYRDVGASIGDIVAETQPDVVIDALGTNDLWWYAETPDQVADRFRTFVAEARAVDPGIAVVALHTAHDDAKQAAYDALLDDAASELTTETSPVVASGTGGRLGPDDTYDGIHPSSHGEVRLAAAPPTH